MPTLNRTVNVIGRCAALYRERMLAGTGVGPYDLPFLFHVCKHPGVSQDTLSKKLYINKSNVTRHITYLEGAGFLQRRTDENDRRVQLVFPTQKAEALLPLLREVSRNWEALLTEGFSEEESAQFLSLLARAFENAKRTIEEESR